MRCPCHRGACAQHCGLGQSPSCYRDPGPSPSQWIGASWSQRSIPTASSDVGHFGASDSPCWHAVELQAAHAAGATYAIANLSVPQGWASVSWRCAVGQTEHLAQEGLQLFRIERLGDDRSATILDRNY